MVGPAGSLKSLTRLTLIRLKTSAVLLMVLKAQNTAACYTQHNKIEQFATFTRCYISLSLPQLS